jgi:hypothetical protein
VFLVQRVQEMQDSMVDAFPGRTRWLKNWRNLWPVAAALTCGLLVVAFVQRRHNVDLPQKADAIESKAPVLPSQARSPQPVVAGALASERPATPKSSVTAMGASSLHPAPAVLGTGVGGFSSVHGSLPKDQHPTGNLSALSFNGSTAGKQSVDALSAGSYSMGSTMVGPIAQARSLQEQKNSPLTGRREQTADLQSRDQPLSQQVTASRSSSEPSQNDIQHSTSQTVEVTNAAPVLQTENAVVSASVFKSRRSCPGQHRQSSFAKQAAYSIHHLKRA